MISSNDYKFSSMPLRVQWLQAKKYYRWSSVVFPFGNCSKKSQAQYWCRTWLWAIYDDLKAFKSAPDEESALKVWLGFQALIQAKTGCDGLQAALAGHSVIDKELLLVLDDPRLPLHNNLSESQIREYVKRRKISGGTKSEAGRQCRDTFASLKKTCRLYSLSFWDYLTDRLTDIGLFPRLGDLIEKASPISGRYYSLEQMIKWEEKQNRPV